METLSRVSLFSFAVLFLSCHCSGIQVTVDNRALNIDGERRIIISGAIHYPRSTPEMWHSLIKKSKDGGLNAIETYVFWNAHERERRQYDFSGNLDLVRFIKTIKAVGLYAILRIGPYVCAEWTYGGLPVWLHNEPNIHLRTNDPVYKQEMETFTTSIVKMMKNEKLFASQGGPIILAQIENEYGNVEWAYGSDGYDYIKWCANLAQGYKVGIPWIMCQQDNAPPPMISTCNGYYCDQWKNPKSNTPKIWTENWSGWFKNWGGQNPHRTAEDLAFAVARFFQQQGTVHNYYMYHGGTNFGSTAGGPYITTSYDYDAPLDEYGNLNQPKWGHLKELHFLLRSMEKALTYGAIRNLDFPGNRQITIYSYEGKRSCFFANSHNTDDYTFDFENNKYLVPAWSVSILHDCYKEVYNTAKVNNAQTATMIKVPNTDDDDEPYTFHWTWRPENVLQLNKKDALGNNLLHSNELLDQKIATNGTNDYLWLMTSVVYDEKNPLWNAPGKSLYLSVHTKGHVVHAFVNGKHVGSRAAEYSHYEFTFKKKIKLVHGTNYISLISATVGLANYGDHYDNAKYGITGPVNLILKDRFDTVEVIHDLSKNHWVYKTGLHGEDLGLNEGKTTAWSAMDRPSNKPFVWYKTTFSAPIGDDPVVIDMIGLGKGVAWVNGNNIGRYWPSYLATEDGCDFQCDYRGAYGSGKCKTNCGKPSQRWYHVPRSFLKADGNVLVLFEEMGGTPDLIQVETVTIGKLCAHAYEGHTLELSCQGDNFITDIKFASFGTPTGVCGDFHINQKCHAQDSLHVVRKACIGKQMCSLKVDEKTFGPLRCHADEYRLAVQATC
ncbi:hypothetical protein K2173_019639 [Erythroxylum novogranatense]|uniref:Beta-galactosidase n=1 Tax=Erythroxylum novogranatense TaxID=1862640 RepID=A0AAV8UD30_9ROSI|nr:hypothetical protein K2173_019639 [Erythroxylum novogranatense]